MNSLYKNKSPEDQEFIQYVCKDILSNKIEKKEKSELFCAIFTDGRNREINTIEDFASFHSFAYFSEKSYPIYAFIKNKNNFLNNNYSLIDQYNIKIIEINEINSLEQLSNFYINEIYFKIPEKIENIINLQPDAMIMKSGFEQYLLQKNFLYLGAPLLHSPSIEYLNHTQIWEPFFNPIRIGNGGMSYRKASFCRWASKKFSNFILREKFAENNKKPQEDLFYSVIAKATNHKQPTIEEAKIFAIDPLDKEDYDNKVSYGFHYFTSKNIWKNEIQ